MTKKAEQPDFSYRRLATMLGYLHRQMTTNRHARVSVPKSDRHHALVGWDVFTAEDVEEAQLEAERLARREGVQDVAAP